MVKGRKARILVILLVVVAVGYIGLISVSRPSARRDRPSRTRPGVTTQPDGTTSQPTVTTVTTPKPVVRHLLKDAFISPQGMSSAATNELLNYAQAAGVRIISTGVSWADFEPYGPRPPGEFSVLDAFVSDVLHRKMKVRIQLTGFPRLGKGSGPAGQRDRTLAPPRRAERAGPVEAVRRRRRAPLPRPGHLFRDLERAEHLLVLLPDPGSRRVRRPAPGQLHGHQGGGSVRSRDLRRHERQRHRVPRASL